MRYGQAIVAACLICLWSSGPAHARETLGLFDGWGAFSDAAPRRCFAIAEPEVRRTAQGWRPFAAIGTWPGHSARGQLNIRLRQAKLPGAPVLLILGDLRIALVAGGADAWAANARSDARILAAIRRTMTMVVETRDRNGRRMVESYSLRGAATAIDAALLACARG